VQRRVADAEESARELRLVATAESQTDPGAAAMLGGEQKQILAGVTEIEEALRGALAVAEAALKRTPSPSSSSAPMARASGCASA